MSRRGRISFVRGEGSWLYDTEGRAYLDFVQGWAVNSLGHSPRIIRDALAEQSMRVINVSPAYYNEPMCRLAGLLARLSGLDRVFFANSGAEANEGAIKLARKWGSVHRGGAYEIIVFEDAFHGRTLATSPLRGNRSGGACSNRKYPASSQSLNTIFPPSLVQSARKPQP